MNDWLSYSLANFIPFSQEVYFRLIARVNQEFWPLPLALLALGGLIAWLIQRGYRGSSGALLAICWAWVGWDFLSRHYASLNWAGSYLAWGFWLQAGLLMLTSLQAQRAPDRPGRLSGAALMLLGLVYPVFGWLSGRSPGALALFGMHPDPTAALTLGWLALCSSGWRFWLAAILPLTSCLLSGITLTVLASPDAPLPFIIVLAGLCAGYLTRQSASTDGQRR